jgi:hypothetical protein
VHPAVYLCEEIYPDFDDPKHIKPTYELLAGIASRIFERLEQAIGHTRLGEHRSE